MAIRHNLKVITTLTTQTNACLKANYIVAAYVTHSKKLFMSPEELILFPTFFLIYLGRWSLGNFPTIRIGYNVTSWHSDMVL